MVVLNINFEMANADPLNVLYSLETKNIPHDNRAKQSQ